MSEGRHRPPPLAVTRPALAKIGDGLLNVTMAAIATRGMRQRPGMVVSSGPVFTPRRPPGWCEGPRGRAQAIGGLKGRVGIHVVTVGDLSEDPQRALSLAGAVRGFACARPLGKCYPGRERRFGETRFVGKSAVRLAAPHARPPTSDTRRPAWVSRCPAARIRR